MANKWEIIKDKPTVYNGFKFIEFQTLNNAVCKSHLSAESG